MNLSQFTALLTKVGAKKLYAKPLSENDNSKNQVYFGPDFQALNLFPYERIDSDSSTKNPIFKAKLDFGWLTRDGVIAEAPYAQFILYPQYPEVRFSGFLKGCAHAPSALMAGRISGRILFLAITAERKIIGYVVGRDAEMAAEFRDLELTPSAGVFIQLNLPSISAEKDAAKILLDELRRINNLGWIDSKQLGSDGIIKPCMAANCGGFTLEAELGISKNSIAEPDFLGWEVKQHSVTNFARPDSGSAITLMTPEPTGGIYKEKGLEAFMHQFGYPDKNNKPDRLNFGGLHRVGQRQPSTGLTMHLTGYDVRNGKIIDADGAIELISDAGEVAASWTFNKILAHWSRKHTRTAYVPSMRRIEPRWQYAYGSFVRLAQETDGLRFMKALACGAVYYDPGIKLENIYAIKPTNKQRSQFRVASKNIVMLYKTLENFNL